MPPEPRYNLGDKVLVKRNLQRTDPWGINQNMVAKEGTIVTISYWFGYSDVHHIHSYSIEEDTWRWPETSLLPPHSNHISQRKEKG